MTATTLTLFCLVSGELTSNVFSVTMHPNDNVVELKKAIFKEIAQPSEQIRAKDLVLWKGTILVGEERIITLDDLYDKTKLSLPRKSLSTLFSESPDENTYIVVENPKAAGTQQATGLEVPHLTRKMPYGIMDVIEEIMKVFHLRRTGSDSGPEISNMMPMLERPLEAAVTRVTSNIEICLDSRKHKQAAKALSSFFVCSGAAGTGKTRYGQELSYNLQHHLSETLKSKGVNYSPYHYYMLLDFTKEAMFCEHDASLDAETILGMRLAYSHFFQGKYRESFPNFCFRASKHSGLFTVSNVIIAIRKDLKLPEQQPLYLFLHVDEFQAIFNNHWEEASERHHQSLPETGIRLAGDKPEGRKTEGHTPEGLCLFKDMMSTLGHFMTGAISPDMIQPFLSGTARREVTLAAKPNFYCFEFLSCPPLSLGACYDIMGRFMTLEIVRPCQWIPNKGLLHLLSATGGLPRALQLLLEEFFGSQLENRTSFLERLPYIDKDTNLIFNEVEARLDNLYYITNFATTHKDLVRALVRLCLLQEPVERHFAPSDHFPQLTLNVLERDRHTILEDSGDDDGKVLVRIPLFFLHRYNKIVEQVQNYLGTIFVQSWQAKQGWNFFQDFAAKYEVMRTNLLLVDRETATLGDIYHGAIGRPETLSRIVDLKELSLVALAHHFPESGRPTTAEGQVLDWRSDNVFRNGAGTSFADAFVCRKSPEGNGDNIICALQVKKCTSTFLTLEALRQEHQKNEQAIASVPAGSLLEMDDIRNAKVVTILITTADMNDANHKQLKESFPDDCLLIYHENFTKYFGRTPGISAALALSQEFSSNFATEETLKKKHGLTDSEVQQFMDNLPYRSYDDFIQKVPAMHGKDLTKEMGFMPYESVRPEKRRRGRRIV